MDAKVLIIEDDKFLLKLYSDELTREGFEVSKASTGEEGLSRVEAEAPDLIILDLILPSKNGFEVLSEIKLDSESEDIPIIILSNLGQEEDIERGLELGADTYLVKTEFSMSKLPEVVKEQLAQDKE